MPEDAIPLFLSFCIEQYKNAKGISGKQSMEFLAENGVLAVLLAHENGSSTLEALRDIYRSNTYRQLENEGTKLWHLGPVAPLEHYKQYL